jgi:hypothetical protein
MRMEIALFRKWGALSVLLGYCAAACSVPSIWAAERRPVATATALAVELDGTAARYFKVEKASLIEDFLGASASIMIRNLTSQPIKMATFYGEFFDSSGRLCLTGLFPLGSKPGATSSSIGPGGVGVLWSNNYALGPASQPRLLKIYLVALEPKVPGWRGGASTRIRTPLTLTGLGIPVSARWPTICVGEDFTTPGPPIVDLALARIHVGSDGRLLGMQVLGAPAAQPFIPWLRELSEHLRFDVAKLNGHPSAGDSLLLVRAIVHSWKVGDGSYAPGSNQWVAGYVRSNTDRILPPVNMLLLEKDTGEPTTSPAGLDTSATAAGAVGQCFTYPASGSSWSMGAGLFGASPPQPPGIYVTRKRQ